MLPPSFDAALEPGYHMSKSGARGIQMALLSTSDPARLQHHIAPVLIIIIHQFSQFLMFGRWLVPASLATANIDTLTCFILQQLLHFSLSYLAI